MDAQYAHGLGGEPTRVIAAIFERQQAFAEHALNQLDDAGFFKVLVPGLNSPAVIARHLAGNLRSRWSNFLTTDGEKPERDRDAELAPLASPVEPSARSELRIEIMRDWQQGWSTLLQTLDSLSTQDLGRTVVIRSKPHTVIAAALRQIDHYAFHIGQINIIARQIVGTNEWRWFTVPPGGTRELNQRLMG